MNDEQKQAYLKQFEEMDGLHVAFCVLGGMFAEGIDLKGDRLIGAIIIGVGLPKLHPQLDLIKAHFDEINQMGYALSLIHIYRHQYEPIELSDNHKVLHQGHIPKSC